MRNYSDTFKSTLASVNATEAPIILLTLSHPELKQDNVVTPIYVVNDNSDVVSNGHTFVAMPFRVSLPSDLENTVPRATLAIDNIGRTLMYWIETSNGGAGATVKFQQILRSNPNLIEWEITMELFNIQANTREISGELGYPNLFGKPAVSRTYRPSNAPGLF